MLTKTFTKARNQKICLKFATKVKIQALNFTYLHTSE